MYCFNGLLVNQFSITTQNRAFSYGDGFFETLLVKDWKVQYLELHLQRILSAIEAYGFEGNFLDINSFNTKIQSLVQANNLPNSRVKIYFWRDSQGLYLPESDTFSYLIETKELKSNLLTQLNVGISQDWKIHPNQLSGFKPLGASLYVMAAREARKNNWDDIILLNTKEKIVESSRSNVFWVDDNECFFTPHLSTGCIKGIRRQIILEALKSKNLKVIELEADQKELHEAKSIFLTNVSGCFVVDCFEGKKLQHIDLSRFCL
jgi:branched-subunit amino acid aminotransferase/4-amino-4-deoxychorismate lyase